MEVPAVAAGCGVVADLELLSGVMECARLWWLSGKGLRCMGADKRRLAKFEGDGAGGAGVGVAVGNALREAWETGRQTHERRRGRGRMSGETQLEAGVYADGGIGTEVVAECLDRMVELYADRRQGSRGDGEAGGRGGKSEPRARAAGRGRGGGEARVVAPSRDVMEALLQAAPTLLDQYLIYAKWLHLLHGALAARPASLASSRLARCLASSRLVLIVLFPALPPPRSCACTSPPPLLLPPRCCCCRWSVPVFGGADA